VAVSGTFTEEAVARKLALVAPSGTVTEAGTATAGLLLVRLTDMPPLGAGEFRVTEQVSVPCDGIELLVHASEFTTTGDARPFPFRLTSVVGSVDELVVMFS